MTQTVEPESSQVRVPRGDQPEPVELIVHEVVARLTATVDEMQALITEHEAAAPTSTRYVAELAVIVAGEAIDWLRRWPA